MNKDQGKGDRVGHEPLGRAPFAASVRKGSSRQLEARVQSLESEGLRLWRSPVQARAPGRGRDRGDLPCQKRPLAYCRHADRRLRPAPDTRRISGVGPESARVTRPLGDCHVQD